MLPLRSMGIEMNQDGNNEKNRHNLKPNALDDKGAGRNQLQAPFNAMNPRGLR